ncbi:helix-turn-helix domain-containing protein [Streptomyces chattanoogensis]|uniref:helix-turn-helix domain-containing protein n=1 Tax=Streptomyces chattanoogensis TaxID=66876 RepID=UPI000D14A4EA
MTSGCGVPVSVRRALPVDPDSVAVRQLRFRYRVYPTPGQAHRPRRVFGCERVLVTAGKKSAERAFLRRPGSSQPARATPSPRREEPGNTVVPGPPHEPRTDGESQASARGGEVKHGRFTAGSRPPHRTAG